DELARRRGLFTQTAEAYGGVAGFYTFGPVGAELKKNIENAWRDRFVTREGNMDIEAPNVMPEQVFRASGHLDGFDDMIVDCPECGESSRADHIVEDNTDIEEAESFSTEKIEQLFQENDLRCPECGESLAGETVDDFNLMFETSIGPGDSQPGYLRPETAQGIFVEFPRFKEYARNDLPFGIAQIGRAYRNEISPRKAIVRVRELNQAELEYFIDPQNDSPDLEKVEDVELTLYSREKQQKEDGSPVKVTVEEAVENDVVNEWLGYFLGLAKKWFERVGVDMKRFRFRQHQDDELSHYASDCWDAEADVGEEDEDWIEVEGFAYRGCYDLKKHMQHSEEDFTIFQEFDEPVTERKAVVDPDMSWLGPTYGDHASEIVDELERMAEKEPEVFERNSELMIELDGEKFEIPVEKTNFQIKEVEKHGENILPEIVEPSMGVDRALYTVLVHNLETDEVDGEERTVLRLPPEVASTDVAVFPLMDKGGLGEKAQEIVKELREAGFNTDYDDSGAIGRRYRRQDEVGTPFCVTVDYESLEDGTVTLRDRDSTEQVRVGIDELENVLTELFEGKSFSQL
ncbi:MAG: glycine--tRNA ligase, partial [Candidatus Nanohaloarchaea archaeon]